MFAVLAMGCSSGGGTEHATAGSDSSGNEDSPTKTDASVEASQPWPADATAFSFDSNDVRSEDGGREDASNGQEDGNPAFPNGSDGTDAPSDSEDDASATGEPDALPDGVDDARSSGEPDARSDGASLVAAKGGSVTGYGFVEFDVDPSDSIVRLQTTLTAPSEPPPSGTLFLWPGLQPNPGDVQFNPIGNGVLQPVLTWGASCAPGRQPTAFSTWWISAQYVNTMGNDPGYTGCYGGAVLTAAVGDALQMTMTLSGTVWQQTVTDTQRATGVTFSEDLMGQAQSRAEFVIEEAPTSPVSDVVFTNSTISFARADPSHCALARRGVNDFVSAPVPSADGRQCFVQEIVLRAQGIPADE